MATTIKDVAKLAGVSPSTVSRVISNNPRISDATKKTVYEAMQTLKYTPNASARNLAKATTKTIGLIIPNKDENLFKNPFFILAMRGISLYAQKCHYKIMFNYSPNPEADLNFVREFVHSKWVDGIVLLTAYENDRCIDYLSENNFPFVVIGRPENTSDILWVDNDNFEATYSLVNRLVEKGHRRIGFLGGSSRHVFSKDRLEGYKRALNMRSFGVDDTLVVEADDFTAEHAYEAMKRFPQEAMPEVIVTTDDLLAFGVLKYCREHGLDTKVTGFNNTTLCEYQTPPLTSVDIQAESLGYQAAKLLIKKIEGKQLLTNHYIVGTTLIER